MDKRKLLPPLACAAAFAVLAGMNLSLQGQVEELSWQLSDYRDEVQELQSQLDRSVSRQEAAIREALETEASLFSGAETALSYRDGELAVEVSVVPKLLRQGESAFAVLDTGESAPLTDGGNGRLTASIPCSLREEVAVTARTPAASAPMQVDMEECSDSTVTNSVSTCPSATYWAKY